MPNNTQEEIIKKLQEIKERDLLPSKYGNIVAENLGVRRNEVYQVISGRRFNLEIAEELFKLAKDNREKQLLKNMEDLLDSDS